MKIAFISTMAGAPWGGSEELWVRTAQLALEQGHQVLASVFDWGTLPAKVQDLRLKGALIHLRRRKIPLPPQRFYKRWLNRVKKKFVKQDPILEQFGVIYQFTPEIICISQGHTFEAFFEQKKLVQFIKQNNFPYILISQFGFEHGSLFYNSIQGVRDFFETAKQIFFVSLRNKLIAERQLVKKLNKAKIISNPVNLTNYSTVSYPKFKPLAFACVARLESNFKGQDVLLQVLSQDIWVERNWILNLYGEGPDRQFLQELSVFYDIGNRVNFHGQVNNIRNIWANNHILLLPSIAEGTPLALIEAMYCGRIAVVTDVGGNAELIREEETGFIAECPSVNSFNKALSRAWDQQERWCEMGIKAHSFINTIIDIAPEKTLLKYLVGFDE